MNPVLVKFNVGGTRYEVSQSLVQSYPNTLLAKSASEQWNPYPNSEIFIERDGTRFHHVLDYMRDGHTNLPLGVSKDAVLEDLKYYGFEAVNADRIIDAATTTFHYGRSTFLVGQLITSWQANAACMMDTMTVLEGYYMNRRLSFNVQRRQGRSFLDCNELLKPLGLRVWREDYHTRKTTFRVHLDLL